MSHLQCRQRVDEASGAAALEAILEAPHVEASASASASTQQRVHLDQPMSTDWRLLALAEAERQALVPCCGVVVRGAQVFRRPLCKPVLRQVELDMFRRQCGVLQEHRLGQGGLARSELLRCTGARRLAGPDMGIWRAGHMAGVYGQASGWVLHARVLDRQNVRDDGLPRAVAHRAQVQKDEGMPTRRDRCRQRLLLWLALRRG
mmetsp:Transcript_24663/g.62372  ORF Transcript_24663/g.62372 Transcript_24663/m.62372 type:complete len:204 (-) Transcript_24663:15-626(-)